MAEHKWVTGVITPISGVVDLMYNDTRGLFHPPGTPRLGSNAFLYRQKTMGTGKIAFWGRIFEKTVLTIWIFHAFLGWFPWLSSPIAPCILPGWHIADSCILITTITESMAGYGTANQIRGHVRKRKRIFQHETFQLQFMVSKRG